MKPVEPDTLDESYGTHVYEDGDLVVFESDIRLPTSPSLTSVQLFNQGQIGIIFNVRRRYPPSGNLLYMNILTCTGVASNLMAVDDPLRAWRLLELTHSEELP